MTLSRQPSSKESIKTSETTLCSEKKDGFMCMMGRVGNPDDILGSVLVQDGKIKGETYQRMPSYRTCTTDGLVKLSPSLHERLLKSLREACQKESSA
ncbi:hypothetical protein FRC11_001659 [Ceratobasidium sp. 423]|nr:hypothetical protein FRC11_001659 [Ceratobasidium sp. 423]